VLQQTTVPDASLDGDAGRPTWDQIVSRHSAQVHRHALRLTGNRSDADDLTQEVFLRVFRSWESYTPGTFEGWLHRVTTNLFLDQARRKRRLRFDPLADSADSLGGLGSSPASHELALDGVLDADVEAALSGLTPEFRDAVLLADVDGLSYEEVAQVLGLKLGTVRSRIHRGRARLRRTLAHRAPVAGRRRYSGPIDVPVLRPGG
jgi:RNA polymerase sigma-70 factor (ECF subfamily)